MEEDRVVRRRRRGRRRRSRSRRMDRVAGKPYDYDNERMVQTDCGGCQGLPKTVEPVKSE